MIVLGINGSFGSPAQDAAAVFMKDGKILFAAEEERYSRIKYSPGKMPLLAIKKGLEYLNLNISDIDVVAFHGATWQKEIDNTLKDFFYNHFHFQTEIKRYHHHLGHAASAYFSSGFNESLVFTMDGSGDGDSAHVYSVSNGDFELLDSYKRPQSLGIFYTAVTQVCGYQKDRDEYKTMGLAAFGEKTTYDFSDFLFFENGRYSVNEKYLSAFVPGMPSPDQQQMVYSEKMLQQFQLKRRIEKDIPQVYKNFAASAQFKLEQTILQWVLYWVNKTQIYNVCFAGGVALNCLANKVIYQNETVKKFYVPPVAADMGVALGNAYLATHENKISIQKLEHTYLGDDFPDEKILDTIEKCNVKYSHVKDIVNETVSILEKGNVIGWFQGRMEYGPRALGNRSILCLPFSKLMKDIVNQKVKFRESYRPFGASVLEEDSHIFFENIKEYAPYMTIVFDVKKEMYNSIPAVTHNDGTCRIQTVNINQNKLFYKLLCEVKQKTGKGILLNTSFNLDNEPIVNTPRQAIASFFSSGLDALVIGNYIIRK